MGKLFEEDVVVQGTEVVSMVKTVATVEKVTLLPYGASINPRLAELIRYISLELRRLTYGDEGNEALQTQCSRPSSSMPGDNEREHPS